VGVAALGAAADPSAAVQARPPGGFAWSEVHFAAALAAAALIGGSFYATWLNIGRHQRTIAGVMDQVRRIRQEKGLAV
jgi:hypothetical protein